MSFGKMLERKMLDKKIKQADLAKAVGIPKSTLNSIIGRDNTKVEIETFLKICEVLDCEPEEFSEEIKRAAKSDLPPSFIRKYYELDLYGKETVNAVLDWEYLRCTAEQEEEPDTISIRHSTYKVSAGKGFDLDDYDNWEEIDIPDTPEARKAKFAVTIKGESMEPIYHDGQIVLVREQPAVDIGETGVYIINGSVFIKRNGGDRLISINPEYDDIFFSEGDTVKCAGKVIGVV